MRNIYDLKQEINNLKNVREVIATLERISAAFIPALRNCLAILDDYFRSCEGIYKKLNYRGKEIQENDQSGQKLLVIFSTDRGLVGSLNAKIAESVIAYLRENPDCSLAVFGEKVKDLLRDFQRAPGLFFPALSDKPEAAELAGFFEQISANDTDYSEISVCAPRFVSVLEQRPEISKVWPVESRGSGSEVLESASESEEAAFSFVDPSKKRIAEYLIQKMLMLSIYEKALNAKLCEHAARMTAMSDAGRSAGKIINNLKRQYFKARQQMITKRLSEVFSAKQSLKVEAE